MLGNCSARVLASSTVAWHLQMAHFLSVQFRRHPLLRLGANCKFPTIPKLKWVAIQFPISRRPEEQPHTHPHVPWICPWTICILSKARWALISSGNAINYFRTEADEHPSPRVYWEPIWEHHLELNKDTHKARGSTCSVPVEEPSERMDHSQIVLVIGSLNFLWFRER